MTSWWAPSVPVWLLLLFTSWCGTFAGAADARASVAGHLALLGVSVAAGAAWTDPLRLGHTGRRLLAGLALAVVLAWYSSPVPRAGRTALILLPAFLLVPALVERSWGSPESRRRGLVLLSLLVGGVAAGALVSWRTLELAEAALPLGHHNLLAAWLVTLLPLAVLPWRDGGRRRAVALVAGALALAALAASRSLGGLAALVAMVALGLGRRRPWAAVATIAVAGLLAAPRLADITRGADTSALARGSYAAAALEGMAARPLLGWGPGAAPWTLARFLEPRPGVLPPGHVVADVHAWPLQLGYELGGIGLVLGLVVVAAFVRRRWREESGDPGLRQAALTGLLGFAVASCATRPAAAPAVLLAALVAAGAALAAAPPRERRSSRRPWLLAAGLALLLAPTDLAWLDHDAALREAAEGGAGKVALERAVWRDPSMPLYRFRLALAERDTAPAEAARLARQAARDAQGLAPFWLVAGVLGGEAGESESRGALERAWKLDRSGGIAPFYRALADDDEARAARWAARALAAEPRLAAAVDWRSRSKLYRAALGELERHGLGEAYLRAFEAVEVLRFEPPGDRQSLVVSMDGEGSTSLSLHAFRRRPWPAYLVAVELEVAALPAVRSVSPRRLGGSPPP